MPACGAPPRASPGITFTGALPHDKIPAMPRGCRHRRRAVRFRRASRRCSREFHWSPLKIFEYMASGLPVIAPRIERLAHIVRDGREGVLYDSVRSPASLASAASSVSPIQRCAPNWVLPLAHARWSNSVGEVTARRSNAPYEPPAMRILIATDAFPPVSGGSGWSTYELARGLRANGHQLVIVQPLAQGPPPSYDGFDVIGFPAPAPPCPSSATTSETSGSIDALPCILTKLIRQERIELIHAQHELTGPASVRAAKAAGIPSVCTVRDYWPLCYWSDLVRDPQAGDICPGCVTGRDDAVPAAARRRRMAAGGACHSVYAREPEDGSRRALRMPTRSSPSAGRSRRICENVRPLSSALRIETLPNGVDVRGMRAHVRASARPLDRPYALFIGKLARNKGVGALVDVVQRARLDMPLVVDRRRTGAQFARGRRSARERGDRDSGMDRSPGGLPVAGTCLSS